MFQVYLIYWFVILIDQIQSQTFMWQSFLKLSNFGLEFSAIDEQALLITQVTCNTLQICTRTCHMNSACRTYDYDSQSHRCRLFEGDSDSTGSIVTSNSSLSRVGSIELVPYLFSNRGQSCSSCNTDRYLVCLNDTCQCPRNTYFDGSVCRSSQYKLGAPCQDSSWCRDDLNYTCLPRKQCGPLSLQNGTTIFGNGTSGSSTTLLNSPWSIAVALDGSLIVGDQQNNRVIRFREDSLNGSMIAGMGGMGNAPNQLNNPTSVAIDAFFNVYVLDMNNRRVMLWPNGSSTGFQVAGNGIYGSSLSNLADAYGLLVDSASNVYVSDSMNHRVTKWSPNATVGIIVAGTGTAGDDNEHLNGQNAIYLDELHSYLYIADEYNHRVVRYTLGSLTGTVVAGGNGQGSADNQFNYASGVCVSKKTGDIYISEWGGHRVQRWSPGATSGVTIAGIASVSGLGTDQFNHASYITLNVNETFLYVVDQGNHRIQRFELI